MSNELDLDAIEARANHWDSGLYRDDVLTINDLIARVRELEGEVKNLRDIITIADAKMMGIGRQAVPYNDVCRWMILAMAGETE